MDYDTPIDLSQLSTRRRYDHAPKRLIGEARSASESCLSSPPPSKKFRPQLVPFTPPDTPPVRTRCHQVNRTNVNQLAKAAPGAVGGAPDGDLPRSASESRLPASSSGANASDNMELLKQQQHLLQLRYHAYQQMLQQQQQQQQQPIVSPRVSPTGTPAASPAGTSSAAASAAAAAGVGDVSLTSPLLYMGLFGFSHMLQSLDAQTQYLRQIANPQITSVPVFGGAPSPVLSGGSGSEEEEGDATGHAGSGKRRSPRALTGKHVRLGTGASQTTLETLRLMIQGRQQKLKSVPTNWPSTANGRSLHPVVKKTLKRRAK